MKAINLVVGFMISIMALPAGAAEDQQQTVEQKRLENQNHAIRRQYKKGKLTEDEANKLRNQQRNIKAQIKAAKADGDYTDEEKARIDALQDKARAKITLQSTDKQVGQEKRRDQVRQFNQKQRIKDGLADGSLTQDEAKDLRNYIKANAQFIKGANSDGTLTDEEKKRIEARQDIQSADIYLQRHNDVKRDPAGVGGPQSVDPGAAPQSTDPVVSVDPAGNPIAPMDLMPTAGFLPAEGAK